jgi:hypothetical protein
MQEIMSRAKKKETLKQEIAGRDKNIEEFLFKLLNELDESMANPVNPSLMKSIAPYYASSIQERIRVLDSGANVTVSWQDSVDNEMPRVSGILVTWSKEYQVKNSCEEQLYVDMISLLLK